jgi:cardiolipin synthase
LSWALLEEFWIHILVAAEIALAGATSAHAMLNKRDVPAAVGWTALSWLAPLLGPALYVLFGINRIERKAHRLRPETARIQEEAEVAEERLAHRVLAETYRGLVPLGRLGDRLTGFPLVDGNRIEPLVNGDAAYPLMLEAIRNARFSVGLATYIFDNDAAGILFLGALEQAHRRGLAVRVLVDGVGQRYSRPPMPRVLRERGIPTAVFLESTLPIRNQYLNMRNHRKILVVDGRVGFTGGLNIREGCLLESNPSHPVQDLHFRLKGPVVGSLVRAFALDWDFASNEQLNGNAWYPILAPFGRSIARGVPGGPDEDFETIRRVILGALAQAQRRVRILSPYFLPDPTLISALNVTALRGVQVEILVPRKSNLRVVHWAAAAQMGQLLQEDTRVFLTQPPFDHTKLMLVDGQWCFFGSANWDQRSLRLNFELNVECYDRELVARLDALVDEKLATGEELTLDWVRSRPLPVKLRNGFARLLSPYL